MSKDDFETAGTMKVKNGDRSMSNNEGMNGIASMKRYDQHDDAVVTVFVTIAIKVIDQSLLSSSLISIGLS
jgi:hypothetical protein